MQGQPDIDESVRRILEDMCRVQSLCSEGCQTQIKQMKAIAKRGDVFVEAVFRGLWDALGRSSMVST
jgi:hypothetical protein